MVELSDHGSADGDVVLEGLARAVSDEPIKLVTPVTPAVGALAEKPNRLEDHDGTEGEPW